MSPNAGPIAEGLVALTRRCQPHDILGIFIAECSRTPQCLHALFKGRKAAILGTSVTVLCAPSIVLGFGAQCNRQHGEANNQHEWENPRRLLLLNALRG